MEAVTISSKYQVVIPRDVRKQFNLKPGQKIGGCKILCVNERQP